MPGTSAVRIRPGRRCVRPGRVGRNGDDLGQRAGELARWRLVCPADVEERLVLLHDPALVVVGLPAADHDLGRCGGVLLVGATGPGARVMSAVRPRSSRMVSSAWAAGLQQSAEAVGELGLLDEPVGVLADLVRREQGGDLRVGSAALRRLAALAALISVQRGRRGGWSAPTWAGGRRGCRPTRSGRRRRRCRAGRGCRPRFAPGLPVFGESRRAGPAACTRTADWFPLGSVTRTGRSTR